MKKQYFIQVIICFVLCFFTASCVTTPDHKVNVASPLSMAAKKMVKQIKANFDFTDRNIQISSNNFLEGETRINLPFSSVLSDAVAAELSMQGALVTVQAIGEKPLKITGSYAIGQNEVLITARLREMGTTASRDLAIAQSRIDKAVMDPGWLDPKFDRIARTLINLLEANYHGMRSLKVAIASFKPGISSQVELALGKEFKRYISDALADSSVFRSSGGYASSLQGTDISTNQADAILTGEYTQTGSKMIFHAAIKEIDQSIAAGASFETDLSAIPRVLLAPAVQSLDALAEKITTGLIANCTLNKTEVFKKDEKPLIFIAATGFNDPVNRCAPPLCLLIAQKFREKLAVTGTVVVTDDPLSAPDLILSGTMVPGKNFLAVTASLNKLSKKDAAGKCRYTHISSAEGKLAGKFCRENWFKTDLKGKTGFLMHTLETKTTSAIDSRKRPEIVINKFKYQSTKLFSEFSDYISRYALDYFAGSRLFTPVTKVENRLRTVSTRGTRTIIAAEKKEATVACLAGAEYYIDGSYWRLENGDIEIKAALSNVKGKLLASDQVVIDSALITPALLELPQEDNPGFMADVNTVSNKSFDQLSIQLLTQKGRNNISYKTGEEIIFFVKANRDVFVKIFSKDSTGKIFRIFPNSFASYSRMFQSGQVTAIPDNSYTSDFKFTVAGVTGNEMVFACASDKPLPDLPGEDLGAHGMKKINVPVKDMKRIFSEYAAARGMFLCWDSIPIRTFE